MKGIDNHAVGENKKEKGVGFRGFLCLVVVSSK